MMTLEEVRQERNKLQSESHRLGTIAYHLERALIAQDTADYHRFVAAQLQSGVPDQEVREWELRFAVATGRVR